MSIHIGGTFNTRCFLSLFSLLILILLSRHLGLKSLYSIKQKAANNITVEASGSSLISQDYCDDSNILTSYVQRTLCNTNQKVVQIVSEAAAMAIQECQFQFKYRRWNCSIFNTTNVYGRLLGSSMNLFIFSFLNKLKK